MSVSVSRRVRINVRILALDEDKMSGIVSVNGYQLLTNGMFDALRFLRENFPTPQNVLALFTAYGLSCPSLAAIEKWYQRGSIPGSVLPTLLCLLELERGAPLSLVAYMGEGDDLS